MLAEPVMIHKGHGIMTKFGRCHPIVCIEIYTAYFTENLHTISDWSFKK